MIERWSKSECRPVLTAVAALAAALCACTGTGGGADRRALDRFAAGYPAQGALYGAGVGAAAGCASVLLSDDRDLKDCLGRAAVGGAVGAAAGAATGYVVRGRTDRYAVDETRLRERLRASERDVAAARAAGDAAARVVAERRAELARLEEGVETGRARRAELEQAVTGAREDARQIARARAGMDRQVAGLDREVGELRDRGVDAPPELVSQRDALRQERDRLDRQLETLAGATESAGRVG